MFSRIKIYYIISNIKNIRRRDLKRNMSEAEIERQMERALDRIPFEMKKIKLILSIVKKIKRVKTIFKFK